MLWSEEVSDLYLITELDRVWEAELAHGSKARVLQVHLGFLEHKEEEGKKHGV